MVTPQRRAELAQEVTQLLAIIGRYVHENILKGMTFEQAMEHEGNHGTEIKKLEKIDEELSAE